MMTQPTYHRVCLLLLTLLLAMPLTVIAQESAEAEGVERPWSLGITLGHGRKSNPFVASDDVDLTAVLDLAWYGERFFFDNGDIGMSLSETARFSLSAVFGFNNERNYFSYLSNGNSGVDIFNLRELASEVGFSISGTGAAQDPDTLSVEELEEIVFQDLDSDLPERDFAVNGGLEALYLTPWGDLQAQLLTDVSGTHNGQSAFVSWSYPWILQRSEFSVSLGLEWKSRDLVDYYYGVRASEALPGRPIYHAGSGTNSVVRFAGKHALSRHWHLVGVVEREFLGSSIKASPIIKDATVDTVYFGLSYQF